MSQHLKAVFIQVFERSATFEQRQIVLGFDRGIRVLVTASVVDLEGHQIGHPFFLETGPFDGRPARLRRQIDRIRAKIAHLEAQRDRFRPSAQASRRSVADPGPREQPVLAQI